MMADPAVAAPLQIRVDLPAPLAAYAEPPSRLAATLCQAIEQGVVELAATLGVPARPVAHITPSVVAMPLPPLKESHTGNMWPSTTPSPASTGNSWMPK